MNRKQSSHEQIVNAVTCAVGFLFSVAAFIILVLSPGVQGDARKIAAVSIYGMSLVLLFGFSTLYHCLQSEKAKHVFQILDHSAIYVVIAGTYTPFMLVTLRGLWGWTLLGIVWGLALAGILFKSFFIHRFKILSTIIYLLMGWLGIVAIQPLLSNLPYQGVKLLAAGGVIYSLGIPFYAFKNIRFGHAIWHLFVLFGCACHFFSILYYVLQG